MEQNCVSDVDRTLIRVYSTEDTIAEKIRRKEERKKGKIDAVDCATRKNHHHQVIDR